jgi:hypothetical protein
MQVYSIGVVLILDEVNLRHLDILLDEQIGGEYTLPVAYSMIELLDIFAQYFSNSPHPISS